MALGQLSLMLRTGIPVAQALHVLGSDGDNPRLREVFQTVGNHVMLKGHSFSSAAAKFPDVFSDGTLLMLQAGEAAGDFPQRVQRAGELLERQERLSSMLRQALVNPAITGISGFLIMLGVVKFVLPRFLGFYEGLGVELPLVSRLVMSSIRVLDSPFPVIVLALLVLLVAARPVQVREGLLELVMRTAWARKLVGSVLCVSFLDVLASLQRDGIPLVRALKMLQETAPFPTYRRDLACFSRQLLDTGSLTEAFQSIPYFPRTVGSMLLVGQESGRLAESLEQTRDFVELQNELRLAQAVDLLEPFMIGMMGIVMGVVCVGMFLPIYSVLSAGL